MKLTNYQLDALTDKIYKKLQQENEDVLKSDRYKKEIKKLKNGEEYKSTLKLIDEYDKIRERKSDIENKLTSLGINSWTSDKKKVLENKTEIDAKLNLNLPIYNKNDIKTEVILGAMQGYEDLIGQVIENLKNK